MRSRMRIAGVAGFFLLISLPMLVQLSGLEHDDGAWENRVLAPAPRRTSGPTAFARATDAWLDDHFGLRRPLVEFANRLRFALFDASDNPQIVFGRHRQLFLTSHDAADPQRMLFFLCRGAGGEAGDRALAASLGRFLDAALRHNPRVLDLLVPTKTVLDAADLPAWMRARCAGGHAVLPGVLSALAAARPDLRARVVYPLSLMQRLNRTDPPYPRFNFHWDGPALRSIAAHLAQDRFGRPLLGTLPLRTTDKISDIAHLLPGVPLPFRTMEPDLAAAGVTSAVRIPELGPPGAILADISRFERRDRRGHEPRLLIVSDSFGQAIAPWFAAYYGEVWHVSINNLGQLSPTQQSDLAGDIFDRYRPDDVLFVFHDFSQGFLNQQLLQQLWHQASR